MDNDLQAWHNLSVAHIYMQQPWVQATSLGCNKTKQLTQTASSLISSAGASTQDESRGQSIAVLVCSSV